ncbi:MAG: hypothetical protein AB7K09_23870 [Planctomycetota bacterium]
MLSALTATLALALLAPAVVSAQSLEEKRDAKLAEPFLKNAEWITDYDTALAKAKETGKPIFGYFTRSYSY